MTVCEHLNMWLDALVGRNPNFILRNASNESTKSFRGVFKRNFDLRNLFITF